MVWQAIGGAALNFGANALSSLQQYNYQRALQQQAAELNYEFGQKSLLNSPGNTRKGLEIAGYNPMLAVQNATSGANAGWTSAGTAKGPEYGNIGSDLIANAQSFQHLKNETLSAEASQDEAYANADKAKVEKNIILQKLPFVSRREKAEISNIEKDSMHKEALIHQIDETIRLREKELKLQELGIYMDFKGRMYTADSAYAGNVYNANTMKDIADAHSPSGQSQSFRNYAGGVADVLHGVGSVIHGYNETNNYSSGNESTTTYYDKNGNVRGSVSHSGRSSSHGTKTHRRK